MRRTGSGVIGGPLEITLERAFFSHHFGEVRSEALDLNAKTAGPLLPGFPYGFSPFIILRSLSGPKSFQQNFLLRSGGQKRGAGEAPLC